MSIWQKFKSRKFLLAFITMVGNMVLQFLPNSELVPKIVAAVAALIVIASYVFVEGNIDAKAISLSTDFAAKVTSALAAAGLMDSAVANTITVSVDEETGMVTVNKN